MAKPEIEFTRADSFPWQKVEGAPEGAMERILARDPATGACTRMLRFPPGMVMSGARITHDFWEEVYILEGEMTDVALGKTFGPGSFACRPPGMRHGPYSTAPGCLAFEVRYFL